jgi:hypothetical protein
MNKITCFFLLLFLISSCKPKATPDEEIQTILSVINANIGWAKTKDTVLSYSTVVRTEELFFFQPDSQGTIKGFDNFRKMTESVFLRPEFQAVRYELKNPKVSLSQSRTCAWFATYLDDINTWKGQDASWRNVRWTGVLEKREGQWKIVQMHFSFPTQ